MDNSREIASFRRRAKKVGLTKEPPQISIDVWHECEEPPAVKPWQLRIMIETKKTPFNGRDSCKGHRGLILLVLGHMQLPLKR